MKKWFWLIIGIVFFWVPAFGCVNLVSLADRVAALEEQDANAHDGNDGIDGQDGLDGSDGAVGLQGPPGADGADGKDANGNQCTKVKTCHDGHTIKICEEALAAHIAHGDSEGKCEDDD